jgi:hypothetical protein
VRIDASLGLPGGVVDLATRVLVAGVVPDPRFGREAEVAATARALVAAGADLVDVSLPPRLVGPAVRAVAVPVVVRADTVEAATAATRAGAAVILVPLADLPEVLAAAAPVPTSDAGSGPAVARAGTGGDVAVSGPGPGGSHLGGRPPAFAVLVDDPTRIVEAREAALRTGVPLALDSTGWSGPEAIAREAAALAEGCRILRTADVRRSRRVAEVMTAILDARRPAGPPTHDDEGPR